MHSEIKGNLGLQSPDVTWEVQDLVTFFTFQKDSPDVGPHFPGRGSAVRIQLAGGRMEKLRDRLFLEWIDSWADEMGLGVPCGDAQADGVPCFELGRECAKCEGGRQSWLEFRRKKDLAGDSSGHHHSR